MNSNALLPNIVQVIFYDYFAQIIGGSIAFILALYSRRIWHRISSSFGASQKLRRAREAIREDGRGLWLEMPVARSRDYVDQIQNSIPIITIANLKGGVGKTTLAANLAAFLATEGMRANDNRKVLVIDFDFQGSLSSMSLNPFVRIPRAGAKSLASKLLTGEPSVWPQVNCPGPNGNPRLFAVPAFYDLAAEETRLQAKWLIGDFEGDIRYLTHHVLQSKEIQQEYKYIIIDAPPRLTTASIQALCASTHVLIPTVVDRLSAEAVGTFLKQISTHRDIWPCLKVLGVVGNLFEPGAAVNGPALDTLRQNIIQQGYPVQTLLSQEYFICARAVLSRAAGERIAYFDGNGADARAVRDMFNKLGHQILERINESARLRLAS
jgi:chromosome partitioning protein